MRIKELFRQQTIVNEQIDFYGDQVANAYENVFKMGYHFDRFKNIDNNNDSVTIVLFPYRSDEPEEFECSFQEIDDPTILIERLKKENSKD